MSYAIGDRITENSSRLAGRNIVELAVPSGMKSPERVRYAWSADPGVNLVNSAGLPATPFEITLGRK